MSVSGSVAKYLLASYQTLQLMHSQRQMASSVAQTLARSNNLVEGRGLGVGLKAPGDVQRGNKLRGNPEGQKTYNA